MSKKYFIFAGRILLPLLMVLSNVAFCDTLKIYENLVHCYRENNTAPFIGNSIQILLELIRKIENYYPTSLDIRTLSVGLIHNLRIDGIQKAPGIQETEFITPYRPNGLMTPKFELLLKLISNVPAGNLDFDKILTPTELCTLHKLISSTVEPFQRGDEQRTCLKNNNNTSIHWNSYEYAVNKIKVYSNGKTYVVPGSLSKCPTELGVIRTMYYGSLSPGTVIASIAAALQPQLVTIKELFPIIDYGIINHYENREINDKTDVLVKKLSQSLDTIDNVYAAGLAGDLAEVCIYQAPYGNESVSVGLAGYWNDILYPLIRYLPQSYQLNWTMTESEILAGIDSFHLATHVHSLLNKIQRTRLSQVLEMYYSPRGMPSFSSKRSKYFNSDHYQYYQGFPSAKITSQLYGSPEENHGGGIFKGIYYDSDRYMLGDNIDSACERKYIIKRISKDRLKEQTYSFAQVLQYYTKTMTVDDKLIKSTCDLAVDKFFEKANQLINILPDCSKIGSNYDRPNIDLTLIIDGSRTKYENLKLISYLSELIDVSSYGSEISVIHGTSGELLVKSTNSIINTFEQLRKYTKPYPTKLSLVESFTTILNSLNGYDDDKRRNKKIVGKSKVILVISQSEKIRENDFIGAKRMLEGSFQQFKDLYFVFLTNDVKMFEEMVRTTANETPSLSQYNIINAPNTDPNMFMKPLNHILRNIPKWMRLPNCDEIKIPKTQIPSELNSNDSLTTTFDNLEYEEYISPNEKIFYKINNHTLVNVPKFQVQFYSTDYGKITVCLTKNSKDYQCQSTLLVNPIQFNIINCDLTPTTTTTITDNAITACLNSSNILFKVDVDISDMKCSENDCRYPDQVRYYINLRNFQCENHSTNVVISNIVFIVIILCYVLS